jgi:guanylate cyclase
MIYLHIAMGGFANSGAQLMWAIAITVPAALVLRKKETVAIALFFAVVAIVFGFWEQSLHATRPAPDPGLTSILFPIVLVGTLALLVPMFIFVLGRLSFERERAEGLLLNVLPAEVANELKETGKAEARQFDSISVLFADIVGFTPLSAEMAPEEMVDQLNDVFTYFDELAERYGCEKIHTIGDNYMVAAGLPIPRTDHAHALCHMALGMLEYSRTGPLSFRLGINSGPAVAGVIGTRKFQYDVWGDTVNTASRMESHGEPGRIQIAENTYQLIRDDFTVAPRGPIDVKGKGTLNTWYLTGIRN